MNIFVTDKDPLKAAQNLCDKHVVKMIVESAQMLINPFIRGGVKLSAKTQKGTDYKMSHPNHPCSKWAMESEANFSWLALHALDLCHEYWVRYNKTHFCRSVIFECACYLPKANLFPAAALTPFALAMPDQYKSNDAVQSYRNYYRNEKASIAKWDKLPSRKPQWMN